MGEAMSYRHKRGHRKSVQNARKTVLKTCWKVEIFVENDEFEKAIEEAGQDPEKAKLLSAVLAYQDVTHGQKAAIIERDNRYTCNVLHRLGFHWSSTSWDYVDQMLKAISGFGYFD